MKCFRGRHFIGLVTAYIVTHTFVRVIASAIIDCRYVSKYFDLTSTNSIWHKYWRRKILISTVRKRIYSFLCSWDLVLFPDRLMEQTEEQKALVLSRTSTRGISIAHCLSGIWLHLEAITHFICQAVAAEFSVVHKPSSMTVCS